MNAFLREHVPCWAILAAMGVASAAAWSASPARVPIHWNIEGAIDGYSGKAEGLLLLPMIALGTYLLMTVLPRIDPGRLNYARFRGPYATIRIALVAFFALMHGIVIAAALGRQPQMNRIMPVALGVLLILLGNAMGKLRPNWFVGIRTPWTLSSKLSWTKTHRLGGWLFVAIGALSIASAALPGVAGIAVAIGGLLAATLALLVYSYLVWAHDPERIAPAGTMPAEEAPTSTARANTSPPCRQQRGTN